MKESGSCGPLFFCALFSVTYRRVGVYSLNTLVSTRCSFNTTKIEKRKLTHKKKNTFFIRILKNLSLSLPYH